MFIPFLVGPSLPPPDLSAPAAIVRPAPADWRPPQPDVRPQRGTETVEIKLLDDTGPRSPEWRQRYSVRINQGGSLTEAATRLFGDPSEENVNQLFEAARQRYPDLQDAGRITAGQEFTIEVDPSRTFILSSVENLRDPDRTVRKFTNGAVETRYVNPQRGIVRVIDFPMEGNHDFEFHDGKEPITVPVGSTLVNYEYQEGQTFEEVVQATYGQRSVKAIGDFAEKTGWRPQAWPPERGASKQIVISRRENYVDAPINPIKVTVGDTAWQQAIDRVAAERAAVGIHPVASDAGSTTYLVRIVRDDLTVDQITRLLYARPAEHRETVLKASGISSTDPSIPEGAQLLGSNFQITIPYTLEPIVDRRGDELWLASGARVTPLGKGILSYFPSGYRELRYRPDQWFAFLGNAYQLAWETLRDPRAPKDEIQRRANQGVARLLWQWDPKNPRRAGTDIPTELAFDGGRPGRIAPADIELRALLKPPGQITEAERVEASLQRYPFLIPLAAFGVLIMFGGFLSLLYRFARGRTAPAPSALRRRRQPARLRPRRL